MKQFKSIIMIFLIGLGVSQGVAANPGLPGECGERTVKMFARPGGQWLWNLARKTLGKSWVDENPTATKLVVGVVVASAVISTVALFAWLCPKKKQEKK